VARRGQVVVSRAVPKLVAPRSKRVVRRPRVLAAIERGLRRGVCWIAAPAGFGKTTAVIDYAQKKSLRTLWYRVDAGDMDIASFFHYLGLSLRGPGAARTLPVFGPEYADQPLEFARRFARTYIAHLRRGTLLVFDDLHDADVPQFRSVFAVLLRELPDQVACVCLGRTLPPEELTELTFQGRLSVVDQSILRFSDREGRALMAQRLGRRPAGVDLSAARGWAAGLVLLAERASVSGLEAAPRPEAGLAQHGTAGRRDAVFAALAKQLVDGLSPVEQEVLLKLCVLPEITSTLARELSGSEAADALILRLHQRQLLVTRGDSAGTAVFHLHDLLRDFLEQRLAEHTPAGDLARLRETAARLLDRAGYADHAIDLALQSRAWHLARSLVGARARALLAQGRRATLIDWCARLPDDELDDAWLCYWLGVAHIADDATAESWLGRAWTLFVEQDDVAGQCLTVARAVFSKSDSWRTHTGLSTWTQRALHLIDSELSGLDADDQLLVHSGLLRAVEFSDNYRIDVPVVGRLTNLLLRRLAEPGPDQSRDRRLIASHTLVEYAGSTGRGDVFEQAVDSVLHDLTAPDLSPRTLGIWLVAFGSVSGRYFPYARRGFPYASAEDALRAAVAIGEREALRGVEFGALYHLQLIMKLRNDFTEFAALTRRIGEIADSRNTTQTAVAADCQAALDTVRGHYRDAHRACARFMAAIEAGNEPAIERWPHFITQFQVLLADRKPAEAAEFLTGVLHLYDGEVRRRTTACVLVARAFEGKWENVPDYPDRLRRCIEELRAASWPAVLINLPGLLAELYADALALDIEADFCQAQIRRRALCPPEGRPGRWPWALRVHVLGEFRLERDGTPLLAKGRAPTRSLDLIRILALAKDHIVSLEVLHDCLWDDLDGARAQAACEQALHRLRKLLGAADLVFQSEGKVRLAMDRVWVDLDDWEQRLRQMLRPRQREQAADAEIEKAFWAFPGPLLQFERSAPWAVAAAERVRSKFIELTSRIGRLHESRGDVAGARTFYLRALDFYPTSERCYEALLRGRLVQGDEVGALEDFRRYEKTVRASADSYPAPAIRALMAPLLPRVP
jgi:LuxR family maltose regulon positive regulatory protein